MRRSSVSRALFAAALGAVVVAGCGGAPAAPTVVPSAAPPDSTEAGMSAFTLTSTAFPAGGSIPRRHTCDGEDTSPDLSWSGAPDGTAALVLVVDDPDARGWVHWIVLDLGGSASGGLPQGISRSPDAPVQGTNDFRRVGWGGPCPPSGTHRYVFTLYALAAPLGLTGEPNGATVRQALGRATILGTAVLEATYRRGG